MTAAQANRDAYGRDGIEISAGVGASKTIYKNTLVGFNSSTGYLEAKDASGNTFAGVSEESAVGTTTAGEVKCRYNRKGIFKFVMSSAAITDLGKEVYSVDDQTVTTSNANSATKVGRIVKYDTNAVWIDIGGYC